MGGMRVGIGDYSWPIDGVATETRKSVSPLFCMLVVSLSLSPSLSFSLYVGFSREVTVALASSGSRGASRLNVFCFFFLPL